MSDPDEQSEIRDKIREIRHQAREESPPRDGLPEYETPEPAAEPLGALHQTKMNETNLIPPERDRLNNLWRVPGPASSSMLDRLLSPVRKLLRWLTLGNITSQQEQFNSAAAQFDNEILTYLDGRLDRMAVHYDEILGKHGKRMEEIDERHLILQQELVRHVHDLVERIEFVFESAEQQHLYLEGMLREIREELDALTARLDSPDRRVREASPPGSG